ncbi:MAG: XdhC/CoxI family protein [Candidatus Hadarchaeota archaeon]
MIGDIKLLNMAAERLERGLKIGVCTVVEKIGSGPSEVGRKMLVSEDGEIIGTIGGGECFERALVQAALKAVRKGRTKSVKFSFYGGAKEGELDTGLWCGGAMTVFVDVVEPTPKLVIIGSGHVALPTYKVAEMLGFDVTVVDDNEDTLTKKRFPNAKLVFNRDFEKALKKLKVDKNAYVAIVHGEPRHDLAALRRFIKMDVAYLGVLGSGHKIAKLKKILAKDGVAKKKIDAVSAPIGLDLSARTPEEISISIAAELVKERRTSRRSAK